MDQTKIKLISAFSDLGGRVRGASLAGKALKEVAKEIGSDFFERYSQEEVPFLSDRLEIPSEFLFAKNIDAIFEYHKALSGTLERVFKEGQFPIVLIGDHSSSMGSLSGIRKAFPDSRLGVIWIDAHPDLHSPYTSISGNMHGMVLAMALSEDHKEEDHHHYTVTERERAYWEKLKMDGPQINLEDLAFIGIRDIDKAEQSYLDEKKANVWTVQACRDHLGQVVEQIKEALQACDLIHISFDVDSLDPEVVSRGTGTPVPNGFYPEEVQQLLKRLFHSLGSRVVSFELSEINPNLENKGAIMVKTALHLLEKVSGYLEGRD